MNRLITLLLSLALLFWIGEAAECTDAEAASADSIWAAAAATSACKPYVTATNPVYVYAPCTATDCVTVVEGVAKELPDCTFSGVNNKIEVQNALTACNGGDTHDAGSPTIATEAPMTVSSSSQMSSSTISPSPGSASAPYTSCTNAEVKSMWDQYVSTAESAACAADAKIDGSGVSILTKCSSSCGDLIGKLSDSLPNCWYDYENMNKKEDMLNQVYVCDGTSGSVSATMIPDSTIQLASSSGSVLGSQSNLTDAGSLRSGDGPSNITSDSSNVGIKKNASPQREGQLQLWSIVLVAIIALFAS